MTSFEDAFSEVERVAADAKKAVTALQKVITKLGAAAKEGDLGRALRTASAAGPAVDAVTAYRDRLTSPWPLTDVEQLVHFRNHFKDELLAAARGEQLDVSDQGRVLLVSSTSIRLRDEDGTLLVNNKRSRIMRPKRLVAALKRRQARKARHEPDAFADALYNAYKRVQQTGGHGRDVDLHDLYEELTLLPAARRAYSWEDFRQDVLALRASGLSSTRKGVMFELTAGTRVKGEKGRRAIAVQLADRSTEIILAIKFEGGLM